MSSRIPILDVNSVMEKRPTQRRADSAEIDVSVVTVVFNAVKDGRAEAFRACLASVQSQVGCSVEHVIVDGASSDGTLEIIRDFPNDRVAIRCYSAPDRGIYEAMNRGIALARGRYVVFLNSDDFFNEPDGLAESVRALTSSGADFSYAPAIVIDEKGTAVSHAFSEGRPFQLSEGMTLCHQTMLTRRETLLRLEGFDDRYRSAADYDLLLRMIFSGCRACRVEKPFVTFRLGGYSAANSDVCNREMAEIYVRLFNANFGTRLSKDDGLRIRREGIMPEALACQVGRFARRTYGDWYCLSSVQREGWRNLMAGQLQETASAWARNLRCPSILERLALAVKSRRSPEIANQAKADDLDFMYRYVQRVQVMESGIDAAKCVESKFGLATADPLNITFVLNDWLRYRVIKIRILLRVDATGDRGVCRARVSCRGREFGIVKATREPGISLVDVTLPASYNTEESLRLRVELTDGKGRALSDDAGAALVYGGLAVWGKVE